MWENIKEVCKILTIIDISLLATLILTLIILAMLKPKK